MEQLSQITSFLFLAFALLSFFATLRKLLPLRQSKTLISPPGPRRLPFIGNLHNMIGSLPHHRLRDLAATYGPLMQLNFGEVPHIVVSSPETAKEMMKTHDAKFAQRPFLLAAKNIYSVDIAFAEYSDYWRMLRKICKEELLSPKRVESFRSIREEEVSNLIRAMHSSPEFPVNFSEKIMSLTYSITARAAFGKQCEDQDAFIWNIDTAMKLAAGFTLAEAFPSLKWLHWISGLGNKYDKKMDTINKILTKIIVQKEAEKAKMEIEKSEADCLLDVLLNLQKNGGLAFPLRMDNIIAVILDIFVGGSETSSVVIEWAMLEMLRNRSVMENAQAEVRRVFGKRENVDETSLHELKFLKMVIKETMRLHPPAPFLIPRECRESCTINGYHIPAKTKVIVNAWAIGRDPRFWTEAERFHPERFLDVSVDFKGNHFEFIPFGAGRKMCPGIAFATADIELPLAQLLFHFDWKIPEVSSSEELDMSESFGLTVRRKGDVYLVPVPWKP